MPDEDLREALRRLKRGELIIHPTESVYGFGGFLEDGALEGLRDMKGRTSGGFVILIPSRKAVGPLLGPVGRTLARAFWPGPLTLVLDDPDDSFPSGAKAADGSVAVRVPGQSRTLELLKTAGRPITSTSANPPGQPPASTPEAAREAARVLDREMFFLGAGDLPCGMPSTLLRLGREGPVLLRRGPVDEGVLSEVLGFALQEERPR